MGSRAFLFCAFILFISFFLPTFGQEDNSDEPTVSYNPAFIRDSLERKKAEFEVFRPRPIDSSVKIGSFYGERVLGEITGHQYYQLPFRVGSSGLMMEREKPNSDWIFYLLSGMVLLLALLRLAFNKYLRNLNRVFFNTSMRQRQITDQLQQDPLPSLLFNIYFTLSGGVFLYFLSRSYGLAAGMNKWLLMILWVFGLAVFYVGKYMILKLVGWIFGWEKAADAYIFVVYMINKIVGIFLLPVTIILAFSPPALRPVVITSAYIILGVLFLYRVIRSFVAIRNELRINQLSFFLYVIAFEVLPVLLIYRLLMQVI